VNQPAPDVLTDPPRPPGRRPPGITAWVALLVVWVVWGSTDLAIRVADRTIPPFPMAGVRYLTAGLLLYPTAWLGTRRQARRQAPSEPRNRGALAQWAGMALVGMMLLAVGNGGVSYAERTLPSGLAALLVASVPLWMAPSSSPRSPCCSAAAPGRARNREALLVPRE
jgi:drug/metabolite transporter (DMT)-like permease